MEILALAIIITGIFLGFFIGTIAGFGAAIISLPLLLLVLPIQDAVGILSLIYFVFSIFHIWKNWKSIDKKTIYKMALGIVTGLLFGTYFLTNANPEILRRILGIGIIAYVVHSIINTKKNNHFNHSFLFGFLGGTTAAMFSTSRPVYVTHLTSKFDKLGILRANLIGVGAFTDLVKLPVMAANGVFTNQVMFLTLTTIPGFIIATWLGMKVVKKVNEKYFRYGMYILLAVSGTMLIF